MIQAKEMLSTTGNTIGSTIIDTSAGGAFQATIVGTGTVGVTVTIKAGLDGVNWITIGTITLSGTTTATDGFVSIGQWSHYRAETTSASGTITSIKVNMSEET